MIAISRPSTWSAVSGLVFVAAILGCSGAPSPKERVDYSASVNRYYEGRPLCLWPDAVKFPIESATPDDVRRLGLNALTGSGLLVRKNAGRSYDLSPEGRTAFSPDVFRKGAGNFCYGRRKVVSIDSANHNTRSSELVTYEYRVADPAAWSKEDEVQRAFPQIVNELAGVRKAQATLLDTAEGFEVAGAPTLLTPEEKKAPTQLSALTKVGPSSAHRQGE